MGTRTLLCLHLSLFALAAADPPVAAGEQPVREATVGGSTEGPAFNGKDLYFTNRGRIMRRNPSNAIQVFREDAQANGLIFDLQGRLIVCESGRRRVTRMEPDGSITVLADNYETKPFNSPNDVAIDSQGRIYFTDPRYGRREGMEIIEGVYRIDAPGKVVRILGEAEVSRPNGILVSQGDRYLYVADNNNDPGGVRKLWRFDLQQDGAVRPGSRTMIFDWKTGRGPDGMDMDEAGRLYVSGGRNAATRSETADEFKGGIYILAPEGKLLTFVPIPDDEVTNCAFGYPDRKTLFITAGGSLWRLRVTTPGYTLQRK